MGEVIRDPGSQQIGGGDETIGGEIGNKEGQKAKNAGAGSAQPQPQRRQEANSNVQDNVQDSSIVRGAERIAKEQQQMKAGANHFKNTLTHPFHEAHDWMKQKKNDAVNGAKNVEQSTVNGVKGAAHSVENVGKGAVNGFKGAVNGAEQGYQEGSNAGNPPAPPT
ncbi:hypothetical protein C8J55DRAFT_517875 [Lentinula edodes]|uniref:Uncharacterized protein n=1 Tax=Lentinula lateritia TaxID=40482 RepID=A0A9W9A636_9AGAR|nr:hypothetical protein C8J55DRAFT_517875 [Lentinula edodes]